MDWVAVCVPLMVLGVAIATIPVLYATHHQHRYGHHESDPHRRGAPSSMPASAATTASQWTVCPNCAAVVVDEAIHFDTVHATALA
jgi:hypothetical protein